MPSSGVAVTAKPEARNRSTTKCEMFSSARNRITRQRESFHAAGNRPQTTAPPARRPLQIGGSFEYIRDRPASAQFAQDQLYGDAGPLGAGLAHYNTRIGGDARVRHTQSGPSARPRRMRLGYANPMTAYFGGRIASTRPTPRRPEGPSRARLPVRLRFRA